jgi:hypothetical protein
VPGSAQIEDAIEKGAAFIVQIGSDGAIDQAGPGTLWLRRAAAWQTQ